MKTYESIKLWVSPYTGDSEGYYKIKEESGLQDVNIIFKFYLKIKGRDN